MLRLNHWWQMEYSDYAFHIFLDLDSVIYFMGQSMGQSQVFIQNILNLCSEDEFTGLEWHGGKWLITQFLFWGGVSL